jgi:3-oxoacyl-(acyl-carrier-protein) synthase
MIDIFYSAATGGFYRSDIHGENIPSPYVQITQDQHDALLAGQSMGQRILPDADGYPVLIDPEPETIEQIRAGMKCTAYQIRQALSLSGLRDQVEAAVAAGDQALQDAWQYAQTFERLHPKILEIGVALGQTEQQLDDLFTLGMTLQP